MGPKASEKVGNALVRVVRVVGDLPLDVMPDIPFPLDEIINCPPGEEVVVVILPNVADKLESGFSHGRYWIILSGLSFRDRLSISRAVSPSAV